MFYEESGGGVTLSGGEVMAAEPFDEVAELCRLLKGEGISVFVDTSGMAPFGRFERILGDVDCFLYDIKAMDRGKHKKWIGADNALILEKPAPPERRRRAHPPAAAPSWRASTRGRRTSGTSSGCCAGACGRKKSTCCRITSSAGRNLRGSAAGPEPFGVPSQEKLERLAAIFREAGYPQVVIGG